MSDNQAESGGEPRSTGSGADAHRLGRRALMISLGAGLSVAGYWWWRGRPARRGSTNALQVDPRPRLRGDAALRPYEDLLGVYIPGANPPVCAVNECGAVILNCLDGSRTVSELAAAVAGQTAAAHTQALEAGVAFFVAQIGELGLLRNPFYACITESVVS